MAGKEKKISQESFDDDEEEDIVNVYRKRFNPIYEVIQEKTKDSESGNEENKT